MQGSEYPSRDAAEAALHKLQGAGKAGEKGHDSAGGKPKDGHDGHR